MIDVVSKINDDLLPMEDDLVIVVPQGKCYLSDVI